ncbi:MAG: Asp-tRNA(Asn)/Glu-tRNA(Gln) amidotransferase subunit GatC [Candidatus Nomurabacteria bacterium]|nr:Asp-tRNA(Asn)/Glu-tRNA(Gln) amidotransferase subunit GatC [Candidatus Nomurabacteria bacterium]
MEIKDVENLAEMSKIELTDAEKQQILKDMDGILGYVKQVEEVQVPDTKMEYAHRNIWREDDSERGAEFSADLIKGQFPDKDGDYIKVKKVL